ncbi:hypothetical protein ACER0C_014598 [Sarotherodon galilaeus]
MGRVREGCRARTRSSLSPGTDTQSKHSYSGGASEGAGERASLWKLGRELTDSRAKPTTSFSSLLKSSLLDLDRGINGGERKV